MFLFLFLLFWNHWNLKFQPIYIVHFKITNLIEEKSPTFNLIFLFFVWFFFILIKSFYVQIRLNFHYNNPCPLFFQILPLSEHKNKKDSLFCNLIINIMFFPHFFVLLLILFKLQKSLKIWYLDWSENEKLWQ